MERKNGSSCLCFHWRALFPVKNGTVRTKVRPIKANIGLHYARSVLWNNECEVDFKINNTSHLYLTNFAAKNTFLGTYFSIKAMFVPSQQIPLNFPHFSCEIPANSHRNLPFVAAPFSVPRLVRVFAPISADSPDRSKWRRRRSGSRRGLSRPKPT